MEDFPGYALNSGEDLQEELSFGDHEHRKCHCGDKRDTGIKYQRKYHRRWCRIAATLGIQKITERPTGSAR
jgi:hypothetical protein